jgi:hypothetical protein
MNISVGGFVYSNNPVTDFEAVASVSGSNGFSDRSSGPEVVLNKAAMVSQQICSTFASSTLMGPGRSRPLS